MNAGSSTDCLFSTQIVCLFLFLLEGQGRIRIGKVAEGKGGLLNLELKLKIHTIDRESYKSIK